METKTLRLLIKILLIILLLSHSTAASSQDINPIGLKAPVIIGVHPSYGFIIPHSKAIKDVAFSNPRGLEINAALHLTKNEAWQYCYCFPRIGAALLFTNFNNPEVIGNAYSFYTYVEPFIGAGKRLNCNFRLGAGYSYQDKIYNEETNPQNKFFATHSAFILMISARLNYNIDNNINLVLAGNYNHISNGGVVQPNYGINFPTISLGAEMVMRSIDFETIKHIKDPNLSADKSWFEVTLFSTLEEESINGKIYPVAGLFAGYNRMYSRIGAVTVGSEIISNGLLKKQISDEFENRPDLLKPSHIRVGLTIGHDLVFGRFHFYQQMGIYIYSPYKAMDPVYQRYGMLFRVSRKIIVGGSVRAHRHVADFTDLRVGFTF